jgi:hypothetical protein
MSMMNGRQGPEQELRQKLSSARDGVFCKHAVAAGLVWRAEGGGGAAGANTSAHSPPSRPEDALRVRLLRSIRTTSFPC